MLKKQIAVSLFLFFISQVAYPNFKPLPGYYIDLKGDSVHCKIEVGNWTINPRTIQVQVNNTLKEFGPEEIKGFGVSGYGDFVSATVTYHTNPVSGEALPKNYSDNTESKTCFVKILRRNVYSLYSLTLPARNYLFISYPDKSFTELVYRVKLSNDSLSEDPGYRNQILALFANEGLSQKYFNKISEVSYGGTEIGALVDILNETNTGIKINKKSGGLEFDVFAGILLNSFPTSFNSHYTANNQFKSAISPTFGLNLLYPLPGKYFKVGLSLGFNEYHLTIKNSGTFLSEHANYSSTNDFTETITSSNSLLATNLYLMYTINPSSKTRFYVKGGINYYFSFSYNKNGVNLEWNKVEDGQSYGVPVHNVYHDTSQLITMKNYFITFKCAAGVSFGRSSLELSYIPPAQIATVNYDPSSPSYRSSDFKLATVGICYYFAIIH